MSSLGARDLKRWVATWQDAGPALDEQSRTELEQLDTATALRQLSAAFELALALAPRARPCE